MKKINDMFVHFDERVDQKVGFLKFYFQKYFPIFSVTFLALLLIFFLLRFFHSKPYFSTAVITNDMTKIAYALAKIDSDCSILSIKDDQNSIDFLNVKGFSGSEVGCLNLAYPKNWNGPYMFDNPTYQGKLYQLVKTKGGIFVLPGDGVVLPNGFEVGADFKISFDSAINSMMEKGGKLNYKGHPLAIKLNFKVGDWESEKLSKDEIEKINSVLKEFNAAMPFTHNQTTQYSC